MGDLEKDRPPKKLKSLIEVPYVTRLKVQVLSVIMNLISSRKRFPRPSYPFRGKFGDQVKDRSPKKVKYVALMKVQFTGFNINLFSSP